MMRVVRLAIAAVASLGLLALLVLAMTRIVPIRYWTAARLFARSERTGGCAIRQSITAVLSRTEFDAARSSMLKRMVRLRASDGLAEWDTPEGPFWLNDADDAARDFAPLLLEFSRKAHLQMPRGAVVLDCGANMGAFTRKALNAGASRVIAIEPSPECLPCLHRTFAREIADGRVVVVPKGVWREAGSMLLSLPASGYGGASLVRNFAAGRGRVKVDLVTIDWLVSDLKLGRVDFIKMDIEGAERDALQGAVQTLRTWRPRLEVDGYHLADDPQAISAVVSSAIPGYAQSRSACVCIPELSRIAPAKLFWTTEQ